jgi:hypothetical protein
MKSVATALTVLLLFQAGLSQTKPAAPIDLNAASKEQLLTLEGVTAEIAQKIIDGRPYKWTSSELKDKKILSEAAYEKIKDKVVVGPAGPSRPAARLTTGEKAKGGSAPPKTGVGTGIGEK